MEFFQAPVACETLLNLVFRGLFLFFTAFNTMTHSDYTQASQTDKSSTDERDSIPSFDESQTPLSTLIRLQADYGFKVDPNLSVQGGLLSAVSRLEALLTDARHQALRSSREVQDWQNVAEHLLIDCGLPLERRQSPSPDQLQAEITNRRQALDTLQSQFSARIQRLEYERDSYKSCAELVAEIFATLGFVIRPDPGVLRQEIGELKSWRALAKHMCNILGVPVFQTYAPKADLVEEAIRDHSSLKKAIANWAADCGQHWNDAHLAVAGDAVNLILAEAAQLFSTDQFPFSEQDGMMLTLLTTKRSFWNDVIDTWAQVSYQEAWTERKLEIAEQAVSNILEGLRQSLDPETFAYQNLKPTISAIAKSVKGGISDEQVDIVCRYMASVVKQIPNFSASDFEDRSVILARPAAAYCVGVGGIVTESLDFLRVAIEQWAVKENWVIPDAEALTKIENRVTSLLESIKEDKEPGLVRAIEDYFEDHGISLSIEGTQSVIGYVFCLLTQLTQVNDYDFDNSAAVLLRKGYIYWAPEDGDVEVERISSVSIWKNFLTQIEKLESTHQIDVKTDRTWVERAMHLLVIQDTHYTAQLKQFQSFQTNVLDGLRALAMVIESAASAETHAEKNARYRGVISILESTIDRVHSARDIFVSSHWWLKPDLFRADYPVRPLLEKLRATEAELKTLRGDEQSSDTGDLF